MRAAKSITPDICESCKSLRKFDPWVITDMIKNIGNGIALDLTDGLSCPFMPSVEFRALGSLTLTPHGLSSLSYQVVTGFSSFCTFVSQIIHICHFPCTFPLQTVPHMDS